ncbi:MAG: hypothetical protein CMN30_04470 [Sandaracinus sp.]|nr:hypothetical protein [Sandaracinus sp.]
MRWLLALGLAAALACDDGGEHGVDTRAQWERAEEAWERGEVGAYAMWKELDTDTSIGREAHRRLAEADPHYREGVELLREGDPDARHALAAGIALAPMDPSFYLALARACRDQGLSLRAAEYYTKFLTAFPEGERAEEARVELRRLDPQLAGLFDQRTLLPRAPTAPDRSPWLLIVAGVFLGGVLTLTTQTVARFQRTRGVSLERLVAASPEFHPAIAYLVGSLRHELLKHRIGAAADAIAGAPDEERLAFLRKRLYGGQPLVDAWEAHLSAFERALGHRVDLHRDRSFRRAGRAIRRIARLEEGIGAGQPAALSALAEAHRTLMALDRELAGLIGALIRTEVDRSLLEEIAKEVRSEHSAGRVELASLAIEPPAGAEAVALDVFRVDLVLILKNVLRNAILAVAEDEPPRHVRLDAVVELEATGEETVRIRVHDSSAKTLDPEILFDRRVDRGLGLVAAAVHRYGGTIDVEPAEAPYEKRVVVAFFRTFAEES